MRRYPRPLSLCVVLATVTCLLLASAATAYRRGTEAAALRGDEEAIAFLRVRGPAGLEAMLAAYDALDPAARDAAANRALDQVAGQKDARASRLFWYTDLDAALAAAKEQNKPVLTLRLLGRLDEDMSCANSRFFRTVLYPDERVNPLLRDQFILHRQSVADVPRITVEFSDGRRLERTVVGNSIHYVLDPQGRVVDGLPGLYSAEAFVERLEYAASTAMYNAELPDAESVGYLKLWHERRRSDLATTLTTRLAEAGVPEAEAAQPRAERDAVAANRATMAKRVVAGPVLAALGEGDLRRVADDRVWEALAKEFPVELGESSLRLIREKQTHGASAEAAMELAVAKGAVADPILRVVQKLEKNIALDTARNEYDLHRRLHGWFAHGEVDVHDLDALNRRVYAELFLMPLDDPWLGLSPQDAYAALDGEGKLAPGQ